MPNQPVNNAATTVPYLNAESNRGQILYRPEVAYGEVITPGNRHYRRLRFTSETAKPTKKTEKSAEITPNRGSADLLMTGLSGMGNIRGEFSPNTYDEFLEAFMGGDWTAANGGTAVLKNGIKHRSFSIEKGFLDVGRFFRFTGMEVDTFTLNIDAEKIVTLEFGFMGGRFDSVDNASIEPGPLAATTTAVITAALNVANILVGGVALSNIQSLKLEGKNNLRERPIIGQLHSNQHGLGDFDITATLTGYFANTTLYAAFLNNSPVAITFDLTGVMNDPDNGPTAYTFSIPRAKLPDDTIEIPGRNADIMETIVFEGLYAANSDDTSILTITKDTTV